MTNRRRQGQRPLRSIDTQDVADIEPQDGETEQPMESIAIAADGIGELAGETIEEIAGVDEAARVEEGVENIDTTTEGVTFIAPPEVVASPAAVGAVAQREEVPRAPIFRVQADAPAAAQRVQELAALRRAQRSSATTVHLWIEELAGGMWRVMRRPSTSQRGSVAADRMYGKAKAVNTLRMIETALLMSGTPVVVDGSL